MSEPQIFWVAETLTKIIKKPFEAEVDLGWDFSWSQFPNPATYGQNFSQFSLISIWLAFLMLLIIYYINNLLIRGLDNVIL